jgi:hypothetical protein
MRQKRYFIGLGLRHDINPYTEDILPFEFLPEESGLGDMWRLIPWPHTTLEIPYDMIRDDFYVKYTVEVPPMEPIKYMRPKSFSKISLFAY